MPDYVSIAERALKAVRYGFFCVNDQIALALDGFCHAPAVDYVDYTEHLDLDYEPVVYPRYEMTAPGSFVIPDPAVEFPPAAVADSTPEAAVSRPSAKSALTTPAEGHLFHVEASLGYRGVCETCGSQVTALLPSELSVWRCLADKGGRCKSCEKSEK